MNRSCELRCREKETCCDGNFEFSKSCACRNETRKPRGDQSKDRQKTSSAALSLNQHRDDSNRQQVNNLPTYLTYNASPSSIRVALSPFSRTKYSDCIVTQLVKMMSRLVHQQSVRMGWTTVASMVLAFFLLAFPVASFVPSHVSIRRSVAAASSSQRAAGDEPLPSLNPKETAVLICKFQNDFASPGGKIYDTVKEVMEVTNMKENSIHFVDLARKAGCTIVHCPISLQPVSTRMRPCFHSPYHQSLYL